MFLTWKHSDQSSPRIKIRYWRSGGGGGGLTSSVLDLYLKTAKCEREKGKRRVCDEHLGICP